MSQIIFNGKLLPASTPVVASNNRGLRYGDGLFETIKFKKNELILLDEHLARLWQGLKLMQFELPRLFTPDYLEAQIHTLLKKNNLKNARVRLNIFRGNGGLYDAENNQPNFTIEAIPLETSTERLNSNGLQCCIYSEARKGKDIFSNLKTNQFLPYLMGALHAKKQKCNDAILLNTEHMICDSTIANVFIITNGVIQTPPLTDGCVAGVMRAFVMDNLKNSHFAIEECSLSVENLLQADEVFLTNSIYNMRWVAGIEDSKYKLSQTQEIFNLLRETNPSVFC
jgi:branched-chain amino acid aminotransferase